MSDQELKIAATVDGFDEAAQAVNKVAGAQKKLQENLEASKEPQEQINAGTQDYLGLLKFIHPTLAGYVQNLARGVKVSGELASKNISLGESWKSATNFLKAHAGAFKLFLAGGGVVAAIVALKKAISGIAQEWEKATKALEAHEKALNDIEQARRDQGASIERIRDESKLPKFTTEGSRAAQQTAERIIKQVGDSIDESAINQAVGYLGGASDTVGGGRNSIQEIIDTARLIQGVGATKLDLSKARSPDQIAAKARAKRRLDLDKIDRREDEQRREREGQALHQQRSQGGPTGDLQDIIARRAPEGSDIEFLTRLTKSFESLGDLEKFADYAEDANALGDFISGNKSRGKVGEGLGEAGALELPFAMAGAGIAAALRYGAKAVSGAGSAVGLTDPLGPKAAASDADLAVVRGVLKEIENTEKKAGQSKNITVNNFNTHNEHHSKKIYTGRRRPTIVNGASLRDLKESG